MRGVSVAGMRWEWAYVLDGRVLGPHDPRPPGLQLRLVYGRAAIPLEPASTAEVLGPVPERFAVTAEAAQTAESRSLQRPMAVEVADQEWNLFMEDLRLHKFQGPACEDPYWRAVGLPREEAVKMMSDWKRHHSCWSVCDVMSVRVGFLSGMPIDVQVSARARVRELRMRVAEGIGCCVGQVGLVMDVPESAHAPDNELRQRVAEHTGCERNQLGVMLDGIDLVTTTMDDKFTLRDYGIRRGQHGGGRVQAALKTTDVESP